MTSRLVELDARASRSARNHEAGVFDSGKGHHRYGLSSSPDLYVA